MNLPRPYCNHQCLAGFQRCLLLALLFTSNLFFSQVDSFIWGHPSSQTCQGQRQIYTRPVTVGESVLAFNSLEQSERLVAKRFQATHLKNLIRLASGRSNPHTMASSENNETNGPSAPFPETILRYDDYNGVTMHLEKCDEKDQELLLDPITFEQRLVTALEQWKDQGKKGIWIHCPIQHSALIPVATSLEFEFHTVHEKSRLILNRWLPTDKTNKLPLGPTHQVGVGCIIFCPWDHSKMLVVQEKTGPAASLGLWKMCTGLSDPGEDVHKAAERELFEETGLTGQCRGIILIRQAHSSRSGSRSSSDLFFVCQMTLKLPDDYDPRTDIDGSNLLKACPDEIAAIQWMSVEDYCNQEAWAKSPTMTELNRAVLQASKQHTRIVESGKNTGDDDGSVLLLKHQTLPLGFGTNSSNTLYYFDHPMSHL